MNNSEAKWQVVDSAARAYSFAWANRRMIARAAALPFFVKVGCLAAVFFLGLQGNHLRQGLVMVPSYFAEGWLVAMLIPAALRSVAAQGSLALGETGRRDMMAAMVMYVLIQLCYTAAISFLMAHRLDGEGAASVAAGEETQVSALVFIVGTGLIVFTVWAVRLGFLYVPLAMGYSVQRYLRVVMPLWSSFPIIGISLLCSVPIGAALIFTMEGVKTVFAAGGQAEGPVFLMIAAFAQAAAQILAAVVSSAAMAYAIYPFFNGKKIKK